MAVVKGSGFYHVGNFNTNRIFRVKVVARDAVPAAINNTFASLLGSTETHPFTGKDTSVSTNDKIAQARLDAVVRAISVYAPAVGVKVVDSGSAVIVEFETARSGMHNGTVSDIVDTVGVGNGTAKTKPGIQSLLNTMLADKSLDGTTDLFALNAKLADGTASTAHAVVSLLATVID